MRREPAFITKSGNIIGVTLTSVASLKDVFYGEWFEEDRAFERYGKGKISRGRDMKRLYNRTKKQINYKFFDVNTDGFGKPI